VTGPALSVVVPSVNGAPVLSECLEALRADMRGGVSLEVLVVDRCGESVRRAVREAFPEVTVVAVEPDATIPGMRAIGFRSARAPAVAVIEDHVLVVPGWSRQMLDALDEADVVGGGVRNLATDRFVDRVAYLCEYSHLLPPLASGPAEWLTGNNVAYRRDVLERFLTVIDAGRWEDALHRAMRSQGLSLVCRPEIVVGHKLHCRVRDYLAQRYFYSRAYAGSNRGDNLAAALSAAIVRIALPPLLLARIAGRVRRAASGWSDFVLGLPLLTLFVLAWSAGEMVGYAAGAGRAPERVK